jgi:post-segregation antitoxin (ccd killing protein)
MTENSEVERKNITIRKDQAKWIKDKHINLSRLVQDKIDEEMKGRKR